MVCYCIYEYYLEHYLNSRARAQFRVAILFRICEFLHYLEDYLSYCVQEAAHTDNEWLRTSFLLHLHHPSLGADTSDHGLGHRVYRNFVSGICTKFLI